MYQKLRNVHLSTGLFCLAFLLMYGASAVQMAHRRWWPVRERGTEWSVRLPAGSIDARVAARALAIRGELAAIRISPGALRFRQVRPGTVHQVEYSAATGEAKVRETDAGFAGMLNALHQVQRGIDWKVEYDQVAAVDHARRRICAPCRGHRRDSRGDDRGSGLVRPR